jgi:hypothetical protein
VVSKMMTMHATFALLGSHSLVVSVSNLARAKKYGLSLIIKSALLSNKEDGQLQWRGQNVLKQLESFRRASVIDRVPPPSKQVFADTHVACRIPLSIERRYWYAVRAVAVVTCPGSRVRGQSKVPRS